ncbi:antibiotic biosynthesis monooxygenase family protein [Actinokineospora sp.]|uniref:antibiotic biosynthesis monooxygenase family protein n=1 Tax=Actinokineospora sp. TaxID=1872133 RepID=UPI004037C750
MAAPETGAPVTFVNRFTLHAAPEEFERVFAESSRFMARQPGFLRHTLLRHTADGAAYLNIAEWADEESLRRAAAHPDFGPHASALRELCATEPNLYRPHLHCEPETA